MWRSIGFFYSAHQCVRGTLSVVCVCVCVWMQTGRPCVNLKPPEQPACLFFANHSYFQFVYFTCNILKTTTDFCDRQNILHLLLWKPKPCVFAWDSWRFPTCFWFSGDSNQVFLMRRCQDILRPRLLATKHGILIFSKPLFVCLFLCLNSIWTTEMFFLNFFFL